MRTIFILLLICSTIAMFIFGLEAACVSSIAQKSLLLTCTIFFCFLGLYSLFNLYKIADRKDGKNKI